MVAVQLDGRRPRLLAPGVEGSGGTRSLELLRSPREPPPTVFVTVHSWAGIDPGDVGGRSWPGRVPAWTTRPGCAG
jgi:hypothetical protein